MNDLVAIVLAHEQHSAAVARALARAASPITRMEIEAEQTRPAQRLAARRLIELDAQGILELADAAYAECVRMAR